jgi:cytochrome b subunit of formate dehydrogenase
MYNTQEANERHYFRFGYLHRFNHTLMMFSFLGLTLTGIPLKFSYTQWAIQLAKYMGGFAAAGLMHRLFAIVTFIYFIINFVYIGWYIATQVKEPFLKFLFGPNSMCPNLKDLQDIKGMFKWFFGAGEKPKFDRYTYWEKFDYLAVFWGMFAIGGSGLILWFPTYFARVLPGWTFNLATIVHSDEALLATGFIFTFHFIHAHLRGDKFPMDPVIFTGRVSEEEFKHERPVEYERLAREGGLKEIETTAPPLWLVNTGRVVGFSSLAIGLLCLGLMIYSI